VALSKRMFSSAVWITVIIAVLGLVVLAGQDRAQAAPGGSGGAWGVAMKAPVGAGPQACAAPGYCVTAAGGPSVLVARNGTGVWGKPIPVNTAPLGLGAPGPGSDSGMASISKVACPSAGNCTAVGSYDSAACSACVFTLDERNFRWGKAEPVTGLQQIGDDAGAALGALACSSPGNCVTGGFFDSENEDEPSGPFVISERNGTWGSAEVLPGSQDSAGGYIGGLSCVPGGSCLADGYAAGRNHDSGYFVALARNGVWGRAARLAGVAPLTFIGQIACSPHGACTVAVPGSATHSTSTFSETNGKWGPRRRVPGTTGLSFGALACPAAGDCTLATTTGPVEFATQRNGTWSKPKAAPDATRGSSADLDFLACPTPGNCEAGGFAWSGTSEPQAFLISERRGVLGKVSIVRGIRKLDAGAPSSLTSLACASAGHCVADGAYGPAGSPLPFLVSEH
jgi:hypothetical protein